jgi:hypothetical protein
MRLSGPRFKLRLYWNQKFYSDYFGQDRIFKSQLAPSRRLLQQFGGSMTIEQFREWPLRNDYHQLPRIIREPPFHGFGDLFAVWNDTKQAYKLVFQDHRCHVLSFIDKKRIKHPFQLNGDEFEQNTRHFSKVLYFPYEKQTDTTITTSVLEREKSLLATRLPYLAFNNRDYAFHFVLMTIEEPEEPKLQKSTLMELIEYRRDVATKTE